MLKEHLLYQLCSKCLSLVTYLQEKKGPEQFLKTTTSTFLEKQTKHPYNLHIINQKTEAVLQILVARFTFFQASQLTTRFRTYVRFIYLYCTFSVSAFINDETPLGISKVTSSSCHVQRQEGKDPALCQNHVTGSYNFCSSLWV